MEGVVLLIIALIIVISFFTIVYEYYNLSTFVSGEISIANASYSNMENILNVSTSTVFTCSVTIPQFEVYSSQIIAINSPYSYKNAVTYNGGVPLKNTIYYGSSQFFILADYPIPAGNYTNSKICIIPSKINPVFTIED